MKDYEEILNKIVNHTSNYLISNSLEGMVLGISGGIDSTVTAAIGYLVAKKTGLTLYGMSLPTHSNTDEEELVAYDVMTRFCDKYMIKNINSLSHTIIDAFKNSEENKLQNGNIKARLRMMMLYNAASLNKSVVLDTDNLTEHYLGFFTIHGDVGDLNPIGQLWKHEIFELAGYMVTGCKEFNESQKQAIRESINLTPTDGNGVAEGGDMAQIAPGCTYEQVDYILNKVVNNEYFEDDDAYTIANELGINPEKVFMVTRRYWSTEHKRQPKPFVVTYKD